MFNLKLRFTGTTRSSAKDEFAAEYPSYEVLALSLDGFQGYNVALEPSVMAYGYGRPGLMSLEDRNRQLRYAAQQLGRTFEASVLAELRTMGHAV